MADYWKSQPRKMCEYCKCWIADNKQSRDFHERGKKHQENVKKKIDELRKKGVKDAQKEAEMTDSLMAMEKAAMAALKKDLKHNPEMASQYGIKLKTEGSAQESKQSPQGTVAQSASTAQSDPGPVDVYLEHWHEATNPEGYVYYWNSETGESVWEKPKGYMTEAEREQQIAAAVVEATTEKMASSSAVDKEKQKSKKKQVIGVSAFPPGVTGTRDGSAPGPSKDKGKGKFPSKGRGRCRGSGPGFKGPGFKGKAAPATSTNQPAAEVGPQVPVVGPQMQQAPFGRWEEVPEEKPEDKQPDLQLPVTETKTTEEVKVITLEKPKIKFREKKVDTLGADFVAFKKRKMAGGQRSIKQREDDS